MPAPRHRMSKTRFGNIYYGIRARCNRPGTTSYGRYGMKGIKCLWPTLDEFRDDMYAGYLLHVAKHGEKQTTIDRIDSNGHYSKENCRWATYLEQGRNTNRNRLLTHKGKTQTMSMWAEEIGVTPQQIAHRLNRLGWPVERALNPQLQNRFGKLLHYSFNGKTLSLPQWSKELGIK